MQHQAGQPGPHENGNLRRIVLIRNVSQRDHMTSNRLLPLLVAIGAAAVITIYLYDVGVNCRPADVPGRGSIQHAVRTLTEHVPA